MNSDKYLIIIVGPTGVGKTDLSIDISNCFNAEIFSCDSRQIYKELNIGVARPDITQLDKVKHHFIATCSIHEHYSISKFETDMMAELDSYFEKNNVAIMCGGSGLYIDAVCNGVDEMPDHDEEIRKEVNEFYKNYGIEALRFEVKKVDPVYYSQVDLKNPQRLLRALEIYRSTGKAFSEFRTNKKVIRNFNTIKIGINLDRETLYKRINERVDIMIQTGLIEEARSLHKHKGLVALKTIAYRELFEYFENEQNLDFTVDLIKKNTRHYARRQLTWFRRYQDAVWFEPNNKEEIIKHIEIQLNINTANSKNK